MAPSLIVDRDHSFVGEVVVEEGTIVEISESTKAPRGVIAPKAINAHTHAGDTILRGRPGKPTDLGELVGPGGWKHQQLAQQTDAQLRDSVQQLAREATDTATIIDFREGGVDGVKPVAGVTPFSWFGRPNRNDFNDKESAELLELADGIGLSALRDFASLDDVEAWADSCRRAGKPFALHWSEPVREPIGPILDMGPDFVVHACHATPDDFSELADAGIPVVMCPRSNAKFGLRTPIRAALDAGAAVALGTDNGMLQDGNVWNDAKAAMRLGATLEEAVRMATWHGYPLVHTEATPLREGKPWAWCRPNL